MAAVFFAAGFLVAARFALALLVSLAGAFFGAAFLAGSPEEGVFGVRDSSMGHLSQFYAGDGLCTDPEP